MHHRIDTILRRLRQDVADRLQPQSLQAVCRSLGHTWRRSTLEPAALIHWFVVQVFHGNTSLEHVSLLAGRSFTGSAYGQARSRLPRDDGELRYEVGGPGFRTRSVTLVTTLVEEGAYPLEALADL